MHAAGMITLRHFLVDDPAARRHPLDIARGNGAAVAHAVAVVHGSSKDVGDGLDAAMRVPGKACQIIFWNVIAEVIEEKKRIEVGSITEAKCTAQVHACAFQRRLRGDNPLNRSEGHWSFLSAAYTTHKPRGRKQLSVSAAGARRKMVRLYDLDIEGEGHKPWTLDRLRRKYFSHRSVTAAAKAVPANKPVIAAVNSCTAQNRAQH